MSQVSDYNIANASGASVRSDLNAVFDAIKTLNSGGSDPSNTAAFMPYVDTADNNNLKIRNSANNGFTTVGPVNSANLGLLPRSGGTMTGELLGNAGSGSQSPAFSFSGDTDTGMYRRQSNTIGFTTAGTERLIIDSNGLTIRSRGDVRFGDSNSSHFVGLQAPSTVTTNVVFTLPGADGSAGEFLKTDGSGNLSFSVVQGVPSGAVFCMAVASVPSGYLECNGQSVSRTTFAALFAVIGTQYGASNSSTFKVPDLRGEFIRGFDNGRGVDSGRSIASSQSEQNKQHNHSASSSSSVSPSSHGHTSTKLDNNRVFGFKQTGATQDGETSPFGSPGNIPGFNISNLVNNTTLSVSTSTTVGNEGGENRPRNIAMMYVIKV